MPEHKPSGDSGPKSSGTTKLPTVFVTIAAVLLLGTLIASNLALLRQNKNLAEALQQKLPDEFIEKALDESPTAETNLTEAIQQWTVNEQHLHLLDEIQTQQLKLIQGLTNRVNQSAAVIRKLEDQQNLLDIRAENVALATTERVRAILPTPEGSEPLDVTTKPVELADTVTNENDSGSDDRTDIDIVLEEAFEGVQVEALLSRDNPAFSGVVVWDAENQTGLIQLSNLPVLPIGFTYQLWVLDPAFGSFIDGGSFLLPESSVPFEYTFRPGQEVNQATGFAVTAETAPGNDIPGGPTVVATANLLN